MNKLILLALSIGALSNTNNVSSNTNSMYAYGLPYDMNETMQLTIDNTLTTYANNYIPNGSYFNNTMSTDVFIDSIYSAYNTTGGYTEYINDWLGQLYYNLTGDNNDMFIDLYGGVIVTGYVDTNGTYVDLSYSDTSFMGIELYNFYGGDEYTYSCDYFYSSEIHLIQMTYNTNTGVDVIETAITLDFLESAKYIYIGGFYAYNGALVERTLINFFLQFVLSLMYGNDILDNLDSNYNTPQYFFVDGRYTIYDVNYDLNYYYPYYYNNLYNVDTYFYRGTLDTNGTRWYIPTNTVIYNGWFTYNHTSYDILFNHYRLIAIGDNIRIAGTGDYVSNHVSINNVEYTILDNEYIVIFEGLVAYNSVNNAYTFILNHNYEQNTNIFNISNKFNFVSDTREINFNNVYFYGTNFATQYYYNYSLVTQNLTYLGLFTNPTLFNEYKNDILINSLTHTNYLDNLYVRPLGAGDNLGNATGSIGIGNTITLTNVFDLFGGALNSLTSFLNFAIFPGITLGLLLLVPLIITLIITIVKLFKR